MGNLVPSHGLRTSRPSSTASSSSVDAGWSEYLPIDRLRGHGARVHHRRATVAHARTADGRNVGDEDVWPNIGATHLFHRLARVSPRVLFVRCPWLAAHAACMVPDGDAASLRARRTSQWPASRSPRCRARLARRTCDRTPWTSRCPRHRHTLPAIAIRCLAGAGHLLRVAVLVADNPLPAVLDPGPTIASLVVPLALPQGRDLGRAS